MIIYPENFAKKNNKQTRYNLILTLIRAITSINALLTAENGKTDNPVIYRYRQLNLLTSDALSPFITRIHLLITFSFWR